jgi:exodeoxyribonuclease X
VPTPIESAVFLVVDTETTGLNPSEDRVCEVAGVRTSLAGGEGRRFEALVNPQRSIPPEASAIHHLTDLDVAQAPNLEVVMPLLTWDPFDCWGAHNAAFDFGFLPHLNKPVLCTLRLARKLLPDLPKHANQYLRYAIPLAVPSAKGLPAHRALADVMVTAALLHHLLGEARRLQPQITTVEDLVAFSSQPVLLKTCRFGNKHRDKPWSQVPKDYLAWMLREVQGMDADTRFTVEHWMKA